MRTQEDIVERVKEINKEKRFFDFEAPTITEFLTWEQYRSVTEFKEDATEEQIEKAKAAWTPEPLTEENVLMKLKSYMLEYGFDKAINHRGLSANRTINRMSAWCWLLGRDELVEFINSDENYPMYGVPVLKRVAQEFDIPMPEEIVKWENGMSCRPGCEDGC